jgi:hypothetical protein
MAELGKASTSIRLEVGKDKGDPDTGMNAYTAKNGWYCLEQAKRRLPAGRSVSQALEARRIKKTELAATEVGILQRYKPVESPPPPEPVLLSGLIRRYLDQTDTLKKRNTYRKYNAVPTRFEKHFTGRQLEQISVEELNDFIVKLKKSGSSANTVLHNVIIIAQFFRRNGRRDITRELQLPEAIHTFPRMYSEEEQSRFLAACDSWQLASFPRSCSRASENKK